MKFVIYCRKSTENKNRQQLSLDAQERELLEIAQNEKLDVADVIFRESKSAKNPGRPVFNEMMKYVESGKADAILCWRINRLTRNPIDGGQIQWLLQQGKIKAIRTSEKYYYPEDNSILLAIDSSKATEDIITLGKDVKRGNREKIEQGGWPHRACFGYINDKADKTLKVNKKQASYLVRAFDLYVDGRCTLKQVVDTLYEEGLRTRTGNKLGKGHVHRMLTNRLCTGYMVDKMGVIHKGNHKALVSVSKFNRAQEILEGKSHPRPKRHFYSAQGFLKCNVCGCDITVDTQKGIQYYFCTNGKSICAQHENYMRSDHVDGLMSNLFKELQFDEEFIEISAEAYKIKNGKDDNYTEATLESLSTELDALLERELFLTDGYGSKTIREEIYKLKIKQIESKRVELEEQIENIKNKVSTKVTLEQVKNVFLDCNKASNEYKEATDEKKRNMLKKLLSNATVKDKKIVSYQFISLYSVIAKAPKNCTIDEMLGYKDSNLN